MASVGKRVCSVEGCGRAYKCRGFCASHYKMFRKYGSPTAPIRERVCEIEGCDNPSTCKKMCNSHYSRQRRHDKPLDSTWRNMIARCHNPTAKKYTVYGGAGITVCDRWRASFVAFIVDMGTPPGPGMTVDRINPALGYEPCNTRWANCSMQNVNRRKLKSASGLTGVVVMPNNRYQARVGKDNKIICLGTFNTAKEAAYVRDQVAIQLYNTTDINLNFEY